MIRGQIKAWVLVAVVLSPWVAWAQPQASEWLRVGVRWGAELRSGSQEQPAPGLEYGGWTPVVVGLDAEAALPELPWLGAFLGVEREGFSLREQQTPLIAGGLWRARIGPMVRGSFGPLTVGLGGGYGLTQLPWFGDPQAPDFSALSRHEVVVRLQARLALPATLALHARGELPVFRAGAGLTSEGSGLTLEGGLSVQLAELAPTATLRGELTYAFLQDHFGQEGHGLSHQQLHRVSLGLSLRLGPPAAPSAGSIAAPEDEVAPAPVEEPVHAPVLVLRVTSRSQEQPPLVDAVVRIGEQTLEADEEGRIVLDGLGEGTHTLEVDAPGHRRVSEVVELIAGQTLELDVELAPEETVAPATVAGQVRSAANGGPLRAVLRVQGRAREVTADRQGAFTLTLPAGTYVITISAPGHLGQRKRLRLRSGERAIFNVELHPERR